MGELEPELVGVLEVELEFARNGALEGEMTVLVGDNLDELSNNDTADGLLLPSFLIGTKDEFPLDKTSCSCADMETKFGKLRLCTIVERDAFVD